MDNRNYLMSKYCDKKIKKKKRGNRNLLSHHVWGDRSAPGHPSDVSRILIGGDIGVRSTIFIAKGSAVFLGQLKKVIARFWYGPPETVGLKESPVDEDHHELDQVERGKLLIFW